MSPTSLRLRDAARLLAVLGLATSAAGCEKTNPNFCGDNDPRAECNADAKEIDAATGCATDPGSCLAPMECDDNTCVDCNTADDQQSTDCETGAAPICDGRACRACAADAECTSNFCDGGRCIDPEDVVYVASGAADTTECTLAMKCGTPRYAMTKVTATRKYMRIEPSLNPYRSNPDGTVPIAADVIIHGQGAILERTGSNQIVDVTGGNVVITGLTIRGAAGGGGADAIKCANASLALHGVTLALTVRFRQAQ